MNNAGIATVIICVTLAIVLGIVTHARHQNEQRPDYTRTSRSRLRPPHKRGISELSTDLVTTSRE